MPEPSYVAFYLKNVDSTLHQAGIYLQRMIFMVFFVLMIMVIVLYSYQVVVPFWVSLLCLVCLQFAILSAAMAIFTRLQADIFKKMAVFQFFMLQHAEQEDDQTNHTHDHR